MHDSPEAEALRLALVDPSEVLPWLGEYLFEEEQYLRAYRSLAAGAGFAGALELADPDLADLLHRLVMEDATAELDDVLALLVVRAGTRALKRLHDRAREMVDDPAALRETLAASRQLGQWVDEVRGGEAGPDAVDRLLGWLATESEVHG